MSMILGWIGRNVYLVADVVIHAKRPGTAPSGEHAIYAFTDFHSSETLAVAPIRVICAFVRDSKRRQAPAPKNSDPDNLSLTSVLYQRQATVSIPLRSEIRKITCQRPLRSFFLLPTCPRPRAHVSPISVLDDHWVSNSYLNRKMSSCHAGRKMLRSTKNPWYTLAAPPWLIMRTSTFLLPVLSLAPSAFAWGALGHRTVAVVAQNYLSSATKTWVSNILGDTLVNVATWADDYRYTTAGAFSASYHYIDAQDNPPTSCKRAIALKFIVHLLGDITQPLHDENKATGGNGISVLWNGATTNLHSVWDSSIAEKYVGGNTVAYATTWGNQIITKLAAGGAYASSKASWLSCVNPSTAQFRFLIA
ncbi:s1/P1 nuclease domain-containing protein [Rhizoctonia solani AG-1 IA]|uniref:S1/P1 nuclease domain-containing protein n=1 Tax=Thanatephorus cucumeris (strain AG1-IA) TaxID=983506 RepID=L8WTF5_THACA|nr:s1/P1 nuclease domain-containing protein [Rhizoctonia solani AG-1 IA]